MNFERIISAHTQWKLRFRRFILAPHEELDAAMVGRDDQCELGKWIHGDVWEYAALEEDDRLRSAHAAFHAAAAEVVNEVRAGLPGRALDRLDHVGSFGRASARCVAAISALRDRLDRQFPAA